jgi:hypothetical protein
MKHTKNTDKKAIPGLTPLPTQIKFAILPVEVEFPDIRDVYVGLMTSFTEDMADGDDAYTLLDTALLVQLGDSTIGLLQKTMTQYSDGEFVQDCLFMLEYACEELDAATSFDVSRGLITEAKIVEFFSAVEMPDVVFALIVLYAVGGQKTRRFIRRRLQDILNLEKRDKKSKPNRKDKE